MSKIGPDLKEFMPGGPAEDGGIARAGKPLAPGSGPVASAASVIEALQQVHDPEIPVNIYDLGLIYDLDIADDGNVRVTMTLTAPACPVAGEMPKQVADKVAALPGVGEVEVTLTWEPPWTQERMTEDARMALDLF